MFNYSLLPEHIRGGAQRYVEEGIIPGDFLQAVICNDLRESFGRADETNIARMFDIVSFFYNEAPAGCWGSREKMLKWAEQRSERRKAHGEMDGKLEKDFNRYEKELKEA